MEKFSISLPLSYMESWNFSTWQLLFHDYNSWYSWQISGLIKCCSQDILKNSFFFSRKQLWWVTTSVCGIYAKGVWRYQYNGYIPSSQLAAQSIFDPKHFVFLKPHNIINGLFGSINWKCFIVDFNIKNLISYPKILIFGQEIR